MLLIFPRSPLAPDMPVSFEYPSGSQGALDAINLSVQGSAVPPEHYNKLVALFAWLSDMLADPTTDVPVEHTSLGNLPVLGSRAIPADVMAATDPGVGGSATAASLFERREYLEWARQLVQRLRAESTAVLQPSAVNASGDVPTYDSYRGYVLVRAPFNSSLVDPNAYNQAAQLILIPVPLAQEMQTAVAAMVRAYDRAKALATGAPTVAQVTAVDTAALATATQAATDYEAAARSANMRAGAIALAALLAAYVAGQR